MGQHGVKHLPAQRHPIAAQHLEVVLDVLSHLDDVLVFIEWSENFDHALCLVSVGRYGHVVSLIWADCNLGASAPSQYGYYLSWGELEAKSDYARSTYKFGATYAELTKYNATDKKTLLEDADDAAKQMLGGEWRMPTLNEVYELLTYCTHTWETRDGISGYKFTGPNGNSIFIPASGGRRVYKNNDSSVLEGCGEECALWTSICGGDMTAVSLYFTKDGINPAQTDRNQGFCIRPVR